MYVYIYACSAILTSCCRVSHFLNILSLSAQFPTVGEKYKFKLCDVHHAAVITQSFVSSDKNDLHLPCTTLYAYYTKSPIND